MKHRQGRKNVLLGSILVLSLFSAYGCGDSHSRLTEPVQAESLALSSNNAVQARVAQTTETALLAAIQDEYKARATYQRVIDTFGSVFPFSRIVLSESQHVQALSVLFAGYGVAVPEDTLYAQVPTFASVQDACAAGAQAEIENIALYDQLLAQVTEPDIIQVFTRLQWVSQNNHLPAFEQCAQGTYTPGTGTYCTPGSGCGAGGGYGYGAGYGNGAGFGPRW